jgi:hypothetical protein
VFRRARAGGPGQAEAPARASFKIEMIFSSRYCLRFTIGPPCGSNYKEIPHRAWLGLRGIRVTLRGVCDWSVAMLGVRQAQRPEAQNLTILGNTRLAYVRQRTDRSAWRAG